MLWSLTDRRQTEIGEPITHNYFMTSLLGNQGTSLLKMYDSRVHHSEPENTCVYNRIVFETKDVITNNKTKKSVGSLPFSEVEEACRALGHSSTCPGV